MLSDPGLNRADNAVAVDAWTRDYARAHLMDELEHFLLVRPSSVVDAVVEQRGGRVSAALVRRGNETGAWRNLLGIDR